MTFHYEEQLPSELEPIAARLRSERVDVDRRKLDELKLQLVSTNRSSGGRSISMKSQVATVLTIAGLVSATGGAVGVASGSDDVTQSAASGQYVVSPTPVSVTPRGGVATGGGSTAGAVDLGLFGAGGAAVLAGIGLLGYGRRRDSEQ